MARTVRPCNKQNLLISGARVCMCVRARACARVSVCLCVRTWREGGGGRTNQLQCQERIVAAVMGGFILITDTEMMSI